MAQRMPAAELSGLLGSAAAVDDLAADGIAVLVAEPDPGAVVPVPPLLPVVLVAVGDASNPAPWSDVTVGESDLELVLAMVDRAPVAAASLAVLLRAAERRSVADGLLAESAVYGTLQAGPEFARWRAQQPARARPVAEGPAVRCTRTGDVLDVVLDRPDVLNALDAHMRDALVPCLHVGLSDPRLTLRIRGEGVAFCAGGHLDEFGSRPDPAAAHRIRMGRSVAWLLHQLADRARVYLHGACRGSGVELASFTSTVIADPDATFGLPEVGMGLIPGAGGTASLPKRIGRHRTASLALTGTAIGAAEARAWGLVDDIVPMPEWPASLP